MNRVKILALLATVALLAMLPVSLFAQETAPHRFYGTAMMSDGSTAPDDTMVVAMFGTEEAATATVESTFQAGFYLLDVPSPTGAVTTVTFTVGGEATSDSVAWATRESDELNLTGMTGMMDTPEPMLMEDDAGLTIGLFEEARSGQSGRATFTEAGADVQVELSLSSGALWSELAHIHTGQCNEADGDTLGGVAWGLTSFVGGSGRSSTLVEDVTLAMMQDGDHAVNVHWADNGGTYTACGNIPVAGENQSLPDPKGLTGRVGAIGLPGSKGTPGEAGPRGQGGSVGREGPRGQGGSVGREGPRGQGGSVGREGPGGAVGRDGANGADGADGARGQAGATGATGDDGGVGLAIVALILSIVALAGAGGAFAMTRRS